jgi:redox-regulated HSP33 family molecular chaperone
MRNKMADKEEIYEAGAFIVNVLNESDEEERKKLLKANLGAILSLTNISNKDKEKILEEIKAELFKKNDPDPNYIG